MKRIVIDKSEDGIKLIKYLKNIFNEAPDSLIYKLLRKKYFKINYKVASGKEILKANDVIEVYLSDDTFKKFCHSKQKATLTKRDSKEENIDIERIKKSIVYEDENLIVFNKWQGLLSQGDKSKDPSVNELLNNYIEVKQTQCDEAEGGIKNLYNFHPSVVNRLDRNTEGIVLFAKTYLFSREISKMISENKVEKHYKTIVNGSLGSKNGELINLYKKDEKNNIAIIKDIDDGVSNDYSIVKLKYKVIDSKENFSFLDIDLITGKSHQIRAQLSYINHPIICDKKYMDIALYEDNLHKFGFKNQKLICYKIKLSDFEHADLKYLSNKKFEIFDNYRGVYDEIKQN